MIPSQAEIQKHLDIATSNRIPHSVWVPPEWTDAKPDYTKQANISDAPVVSNKPITGAALLKDRLEAQRARYPGQLDHIRAERPLEPAPNQENASDLTLLPHPASDDGHVDPGVYSSEQTTAFREAIGALNKLAASAENDGELRSIFEEVLPKLGRADEMLSDKPKGMQRLKLVFEQFLSHVTLIFGEINAALTEADEGKGKEAYDRARTRYIEFLRDLDDHEPKESAIVPGERGYGLTIKWFYVLPLIHDGQIKGAKVIAKWNPHVSSSGVPVPHD